MGIKSILKKIPGIKQYNEKFESLYIRLNNIENAVKSVESLQRRTYMDIMQKDFEHGGYFYDYMKAVKKATSVYGADVNFIRTGRKNDGGYVMADCFEGVKTAYSLGICDDVSWDKDMAERNIDVFMYDHTIDKLPEENPRFHFFKCGIGGKSEGMFKTLDDLISENGHENDNNMILKMDIEGSEWDVIEKTEALPKFSQIAIELHDLCLGADERIVRCLEKLAETHVPVHIHANNCSDVCFFGDAMLPDALEITYLRRSDFEFSENTRFFPTPLDMKNDTSKPEIILGKWN